MPHFLILLLFLYLLLLFLFLLFLNFFFLLYFLLLLLFHFIVLHILIHTLHSQGCSGAETEGYAVRLFLNEMIHDGSFY